MAGSGSRGCGRADCRLATSLQSQARQRLPVTELCRLAFYPSPAAGHLQQRLRSGYWKATTETRHSWRAERTSARLLPGLVSFLIFFVGRIKAGKLLPLLHLLNQPALE